MLLIVDTAPYGSEGPFHAFRLAEAVALRGDHIEVFLMGDAVHAARVGQDPRGAHASLETHLDRLVERGVEVVCCGTCCTTRGLSEEHLIRGVRMATIHDLAGAVARHDKVVSL